MAGRKSKKLSLTPAVQEEGAGPALPVLMRTNGFPLALTQAHLDEVERLVSTGASKRYVARVLGLREADFERVLGECPPLAAAVEAGISNDEFEVSQVLRREAVDGDIQAMSLYLKAKHSWKDREAASGGAPVVNINISGLLDRGVTIEGKDGAVDSL